MEEIKLSRMKTDTSFIIDPGRPIIEELFNGPTSAKIISVKINRPPSTLSRHLTRLKELGIISAIDNKDGRIQVLRKIDVDGNSKNAEPLQLTPIGNKIVQLFHNERPSEWNNEINKILDAASPQAQDITVSAIQIKIIKILEYIHDGKNVTELLRQLLNNLMELSNKNDVKWSRDVEIRNNLYKMLNIDDQDSTILLIRIISLLFRISEYPPVTENKKDVSNEIFTTIANVAMSEDDVGREALLALVNFKKGDQRYSNEAFFSILNAIRKSYSRLEPDRIAINETEFEVIKSVYKYLSPEQKKMMSVLDECLPALDKKQFIKCLKTGKPPVKRCINDNNRVNRLINVLTMMGYKN